LNKIALKGVRIADFSIAWAGAHIGTLLSFFGAEVIKIETRLWPDHTRRLSITSGETFEDLDRSKAFSYINLNKLSITLDLSTEEGVALAKKIVGISDVVVENLRFGRMESFGLNYESIREVRPDIIYLSSSARGRCGPEKNYVGYAPSFAALGGLSYITGYEEGPPSQLLGEIDSISAVTSAFAILAALYHRKLTGEGQYIDLSSSDVVSVLMGDVFMDYAMNERAQGPKGNKDEHMAPHNCYRCKGEDKWISIAISNDDEWKSFCRVLENPKWCMNDKFSNEKNRLGNRKELDRLIEEWTSNYTHYEIMEKLQKVDVPAAPSLNSEELYHDPHLKERSLFKEIEHPLIGNQTVVEPPWRLSDTPPKINRHGPLLGEHNEYVFGKLLGLPDKEINRLIEKKVIF